MASPDFLPKTVTAIESRFVIGIVPRSVNFRGAMKRRCLPSEVRTRIATSSTLQVKAAATAFTTRSDMSRRRSFRSGILSFCAVIAPRMS